MWMGINSNDLIVWVSPSKVDNFDGEIVEAPNGAKPGLHFKNGYLYKTIDCCIYELSIKRSEIARSGVIVNGVPMQTDKDSISAMDQYATESVMNGLTVVHWEKADGSFHDWPIADFKKLFSEITKYVNDCFGRQKVLIDEINSAEDPQTVDISTGWPSKELNF